MLIVTVIPVEVFVFPEASRAVTVSVYVPLGLVWESHVRWYLVGPLARSVQLSGASVVTSAPMG